MRVNFTRRCRVRTFNNLNREGTLIIVVGMGSIDLLLSKGGADSATGFDLLVERFVECEVESLVGEIGFNARSHEFFFNSCNSFDKSSLFYLKLNIF